MASLDQEESEYDTERTINCVQRVIVEYSDHSSQYPGLSDQEPLVASASTESRPQTRGSKKNDPPKLPRLHWIGVGYMGAFPFHAAGYGSQDQSRNTMSCVISTYASTLAMNTFASQRSIASQKKSSRLLLVAMPQTPGQPELPGVEKEAKAVRSALRAVLSVDKRQLPSKETILRELPSYSYIHCSCHGNADPQSPFRSGLYLCGDEPEKCFENNIRNGMLTVEDISSANAHKWHTFLLVAQRKVRH